MKQPLYNKHTINKKISRKRVISTKWWIPNAHPFTEMWKISKQRLSNPTLPKFWKEAKLDNKQAKAEQRKRQLKNGRRDLYNRTLMHFLISPGSAALKNSRFCAQCGTILLASEGCKANLTHNEGPI